MNIQARHHAQAVFELSARGHQLVSDNSLEQGGTDAGPMPSEFLLCAVASCFGQAVQYVAKKMRKEIKGLSLDVEGVKDPKYFRFSTVNIRLSSASPPEQLEKVADLAKKYCFVVNSMSIPVTYEIVDNDRQAARQN